jgi:SWI/SNF-related matrix-associated actin-dependent regulator of chromatin subfamily A member 5
MKGKHRVVDDEEENPSDEDAPTRLSK